MTRLDVILCNVFFVVPASPEDARQTLTAEDHEQIFAELYAAPKYVHFQIKSTKANATSAIGCSSAYANRTGGT